MASVITIVSPLLMLVAAHIVAGPSRWCSLEASWRLLWVPNLAAFNRDLIAAGFPLQAVTPVC